MAYTDGSGKHAGYARHLRTAGYGVYWGAEGQVDVAAQLTGPWQSAQRGEISAVLSAVRTQHVMIW